MLHISFKSNLNYYTTEDMWTLCFSKSIPFDKKTTVSKLSCHIFSFIICNHVSCKYHLYLVMKNILLLFRLMLTLLLQSAHKKKSQLSAYLLANSKYLSYSCQVSI